MTQKSAEAETNSIIKTLACEFGLKFMFKNQDLNVLFSILFRNPFIFAILHFAVSLVVTIWIIPDLKLNQFCAKYPKCEFDSNWLSSFFNQQMIRLTCL